MGVSHALPVHFAHNPLVLGTQAGEDFRRALSGVAPGVAVDVVKPGESHLLQI